MNLIDVYFYIPQYCIVDAAPYPAPYFNHIMSYVTKDIT